MAGCSPGLQSRRFEDRLPKRWLGRLDDGPPAEYRHGDLLLWKTLALVLPAAISETL